MKSSIQLKYSNHMAFSHFHDTTVNNSGLYFIGILVLTVIFGLQYKITIFQRNGVNAVIYEKHMKDAEEFVKDIKLLTGV